MPLVTFDDRRVGIHALIVGVSDYTYLPGDDDPPDARKFGMKKLKAPSFGAFRFLQWLKTADREARLAQPLASYDVVLAPSVEEKTVLGHVDYIDDASTSTFIQKTWDWRERVATDAANIALFYFSGHGIQRNKDDAVLMLQDFRKPNGPILDNAVSFFEIFSGMAPSNDYPNMGMTQFYFVDACRNLPDQIKNFSRLRTRVVFDDYLGGRDDGLRRFSSAPLRTVLPSLRSERALISTERCLPGSNAARKSPETSVADGDGRSPCTRLLQRSPMNSRSLRLSRIGSPPAMLRISTFATSISRLWSTWQFGLSRKTGAALQSSR